MYQHCIPLTAILKGGYMAESKPTTARRIKYGAHNVGAFSTYNSWRSMISRCKNPNDAAYHIYGGVGISVCDEWLDFFVFRNDMGERSAGMSIDRIDNSLGYSKANCRWATAKQQARNRTSNILIEYCGEIKCLTEWTEVLGLSYTMISQRIHSGMSPIDALTKKKKEVPLYSFNGEIKSLSELAKQLGMNQKTLWNRINRGWPLQRAFDAGLKNTKPLYDVRGVKMTITQLANETGMNLATLHARIRRGRPLKEAV